MKSIWIHVQEPVTPYRCWGPLLTATTADECQVSPGCTGETRFRIRTHNSFSSCCFSSSVGSIPLQYLHSSCIWVTLMSRYIMVMIYGDATPRIQSAQAHHTLETCSILDVFVLMCIHKYESGTVYRDTC